MAVTIQTRRDDSIDWSTANPVLALGEIGIETDTDRAKYGDGFTAWNDLDYRIDQHAVPPVDSGTVDGQTLRWETDTGEWQATSSLVVTDIGSVWVGSESATGVLNVYGNLADTQYDTPVLVTLARKGGQVTAGQEVARLQFQAANDVGGIQNIARINAIAEVDITGTSRNGALLFLTSAATGAVQERMRISSSGNLLVGRTSQIDTERLTVLSTQSSAAFSTTQAASGLALVEFYASTTTRVSYVDRNGVYQGGTNPLLTMVDGDNLESTVVGLKSDLAAAQAQIAAQQQTINTLLANQAGIDQQGAALQAQVDALEAAFNTHKNAGAFQPDGHGGPS